MSEFVATLSGVIGIESMEGKTAKQLIQIALAHWNIPKESVEGAFVTVHNNLNNKYKPVQDDELVGKLDPDTDVVRVVLPLKTMSLDDKDTKQYLVE